MTVTTDPSHAAEQPLRGYDVPALVGDPVDRIATPALIIDLDAFEYNLALMGRWCRDNGVHLRAHGKAHKTPAVALAQMQIGGAVGICAQKVSEAEAFARAGVSDILVSNQVTDPLKIARLCALAKTHTISVCVDDLSVVPLLGAGARNAGVELHCLVEINLGQDRCGVDIASCVPLARAIANEPGLIYAGLQAYHGKIQHVVALSDREAAVAEVADNVRHACTALAEAGLPAAKVTGGGTGTFVFDARSGVYDEIQAGSYAFMDVDYAHNEPFTDLEPFRNSLFIATTVMSVAHPSRAICDAGLKAMAHDAGPPSVVGRPDLRYLGPSDEHGTIADPDKTLRINERLMLVPGHTDPTFNLHDYAVCVRDGQVEALWPIAARGKGF